MKRFLSNFFLFFYQLSFSKQLIHQLCKEVFTTITTGKA